MDVEQFLRNLTISSLTQVKEQPEPHEEYIPMKTMKQPKPSETVIDEPLVYPQCYLEAIQALQSKGSSTIVGRKHEIHNICMFLRKAFASERVSSILNISGIPSIGKSDTVRAAINKILSKCTENVMVVELDAHKFNSLRRLYRELLHKLTNQNNPQEIDNIQQQLDTIFGNKQSRQTRLSPAILLVIDNLDQLSQHQCDNVIIKLCTWLSQSTLKLVVIIISTSIHFSNKLKSINFQGITVDELILRAYSPTEMQSIIKQKLQKYSKLFLPEALKWLCQKDPAKCNLEKLFRVCVNALNYAREHYSQEVAYFNQFSNSTFQHPDITVCIDSLMIQVTQQPNWLELIFCCLLKIEKLTMFSINQLLQNNPMRDCTRELLHLILEGLQKNGLVYPNLNVMTIVDRLSRKRMLIIDEWYNPRYCMTDTRKLILKGCTVQLTINLTGIKWDTAQDKFIPVGLGD